MVTPGDRPPFFAQDTMANRNINSHNVARIRLHDSLTSGKIMCHVLYRNKSFQSSWKYNCVHFTCCIAFLRFICLALWRERMGDFQRGDHGERFPSFPPLFPSRKEDGVVSELRMVVGGEEPLLDDKARDAEQEGPVWCLNTPEARLGEIFLVGGYLLEVNSAVSFGWMLMRTRLHKGQLVSFCSLCYKPPPISGQASHNAGRGVMKQSRGFSQTDGTPAVFADG